MKRYIINATRYIINVMQYIIDVRRYIVNAMPYIVNARREYIENMIGNPDKIYTLTGADGKSYESKIKGTLGGHRKDKIYGALNCAGAARWIAKGHYVKHRVFFADEQTAIAAGYRPCYECLREKYKQWKANQK